MSTPVVKGSRIWVGADGGKRNKRGKKPTPNPKAHIIVSQYHMILTHYDMSFGRVLTAVDRSLSRTPM